MKLIRRAVRAFAASAVVSLAMTGCGSNNTPDKLSGVASSTAALQATISLKDSSVPPRSRVGKSDASGAFTFDVSGLQPPYMLKAEWDDDVAGVSRLYSVTDGNGSAHVDPITNSAVAAAAMPHDAAQLNDSDDPEQHRRAASHAVAFLAELRTVLAPLFDLYGIGSDLRTADRAAVRALLADVRFAVEDGSIVVTNRATGGIIFTGQLGQLDQGTYHAENLPTAPTPTPTPTIDGAALYGTSCAGCHGPLATSSKRGATAAGIQSAIANGTGGMGSLSSLSAAQLQAIADALAVATPPPPSACTYTYNAWDACQSNNTQTRTVASAAPAGCTGTPDLSQACTYTPPPAGACTYTYSAWGACQSDNTQTRTVASASPAGCTGTPDLSQACTYTPPPPAACTYTYSAWGACQSNNTQTRTVASASPAGCTGTPDLSQACTYTPPPPAACTYTYSAWGACQSNNTQTRTVASASPAGCTGTPDLSQACTYTPPLDGAALYTQYCSGCHGNAKKGSSVSAIQGAISTNRGGMGSLSSLTTAQIQAISAAP